MSLCATALAVLAGASALVLQAWGSNRIVMEALEIRAAHGSDAYDGWRSARDYLEANDAPGRRDASVQELLGVARVRAGDAKAALGSLIEALRRRPVSAFTWADVAEAKYESGHVDGIFRAALRNAASLGGNEAEVQRTVLSYGLATWDEVDDETRRAIDRMAALAMRRDTEGTLQIAERRGRLPIVCRHLRRDTGSTESLLRLCQKGGGAT